MQKTCTECSSSFTITPRELELYKKFNVPPLQNCFACHQQHLLSFRNERTLYNRTCDATEKNIISIYAPESPYKIYDREYWYSDAWDALQYGRDFDFSRPFFEQFHELKLQVPRAALFNLNNENSDYCNMTIGNKNCYLIFGGDFNQDCMYGVLCMNSRDSLDIDYSEKSELCYMMDNSENCYNCQFTWNSKNSRDCTFIVDCVGCTDCILSSNLQNKSYYIENKQYTKEEYFKKKKEILSDSYSKQQENWEKFTKLKQEKITKYAHITGSENCTGDYIRNSKNCQNVYDIAESEDVVNALFAARTKDTFNSSLIGHGTELAFSCLSIIGGNTVFASHWIADSANVDYSDTVMNSHDILGCVGIRRKEYCILNKQYSKEEYEKLRVKIMEHMQKTGEWGQFFPKALSPFGYNESSSQKYWPLTKEQALAKGFQWQDDNTKSHHPQTTKLPDNIKEVPDSITQEILACQTCQKNFKVLPKELEFYKKQNIPVPRTCPDCRHLLRFSLRNPYRLYNRQCTKCAAPIQTTYSPSSPEILYCEACYLKEVY